LAEKECLTDQAEISNDRFQQILPTMASVSVAWYLRRVLLRDAISASMTSLMANDKQMTRYRRLMRIAVFSSYKVSL